MRTVRLRLAVFGGVILLLGCELPAESPESEGGPPVEAPLTVALDLPVEAPAARPAPEPRPELPADPPDPVGEAEALDAVELPVDFNAHVTRTVVALPEQAIGGGAAYGTWETAGIGPRPYHDRYPDGSMLSGYTGASGAGHATVIDDGLVVDDFSFPGLAVRGVVAHDDGGFAVLLHGVDPETDEATVWLERYDFEGAREWSSNLNSGTTWPNFWVSWIMIGDARLTYGDGRYAAYYSVQNAGGHHGDQVAILDDQGELSSGNFWGCSHSMAQAVAWHPLHDRFMPICSSDDLPQAGILAWGDDGRTIYAGGGAGNGLTSAQLGRVEPTLGSSFLVAFNAIERPCCEAHGVGIGEVDLDGYPTRPVTWLTEGDGGPQRDPLVVRVGPDHGPEWYLVGWRITDDSGAFRMGIIDRDANFLAGPMEVNQGFEDPVFWGRRDDDWRRFDDGTVGWIHLSGNASDVHVFEFAL